jgi:aspartate/methionine/tyrosine aminotransferase
MENRPQVFPQRVDDNSAVWMEFKELAERYQCVSLGDGAPAANPPEFLVEELKKGIAEGHNQYSRSHGHPLLVNKVAEVYGKKLGVTIDQLKGVIVSAGAFNVICNILTALINPGQGEEVLVFEPGWPCYIDFIQYAGGVYRPLALEMRDGQWHFNID